MEFDPISNQFIATPEEARLLGLDKTTIDEAAAFDVLQVCTSKVFDNEDQARNRSATVPGGHGLSSDRDKLTRKRMILEGVAECLGSHIESQLSIRDIEDHANRGQ